MLSRAIDKEFEEADDTGVLDISGRNLRQFPVIPGDLVDFKLIFEADLSKNRFDKVPKEVVSFKALVKLNCHHNSIRWLPEELYLLVNLKEIDFSRNFLQKFPGEICSMNLHAINLSNNRLISLPNDIGKLKTVQFLDLSCNQLPELPESFYTLKTLRHLGLHRNCLRDLSEDLCQMTELQYLDVSSNNLCRVPISLRHIRSLQIFSADDNPLESPPPQICSRGLVHLCKYLERQEKSGSDLSLYGPNSRDDTLRRRERTYKRLSNMHKSSAETTPVPNGDDREMGLLDEMASLVNKTFGEKDGEHTPTGSLHWSIAQFVTPDKPSSAGSGGGGGKEDYREAAYRLYLQQEGNKARNKHGNRPSSPAGSSSLNETSTSSPTGSLPKLKSDENVYRTTSGELANSRSLSYAGRSLSNEKFPRSGSWNSHMRITSPVLPSKYVTPDKISEDKAQSRRRSIPCGNDSPTLSTSSNSTVDALPSSTSSSAETTPTRQRSSPVLSSTPIIPAGSSSSTNSSNSSSSSSSSKSNDAKSSKSSKRRPPPLDTSSHSHNGETKGCDSDREGSLTPTNESPPTLYAAEEPTTPKDDEAFADQLEGLQSDGIPVAKSVSFASSVDNISSSPQSSRGKTKPAPPPTPPKSGKRLSSLMDNMEIHDLEVSPPAARRLPPVSSPDHEPVTNDSGSDRLSVSPKDGTWPRLTSPRKKAEKNVFKFLKESDPNYTIRRQQMQMNLLLEKNQHVKQTVENLVGVQLSDDLGEWVTDGVVLCRVVNKLHPGTITTIHSPQPGQSLSRIKQTINISAFIDACKTLKVPEEQLCSAGDIIELKDPVRVVACLQRVLESKPGNLI